MSATDRCQCHGCVDCLVPAHASSQRQDGHHCQRSIVHFIDNRCDECHEEEIDEMFTASGRAIHKPLSTDESNDPPF
jgi:hypothetical protein